MHEIHMSEAACLRIVAAQAKLELARLQASAIVNAAVAAHQAAMTAAGLNPDENYSLNDETFTATLVPKP